MEKHDLKSISDMTEAVGVMKKLNAKLSWLMNEQPLQQFKGVLSSFEKIAISAEANRDTEMLQMLFYEIIPEFDKLEEIYRSIGVAISELDPIQMNRSLCEKQCLLDSLHPNNIVHIAADTTANAGDYILVRSVKRLVENSSNGRSLHWSTVSVREQITEGFVEACNRSNGVILGGGGFFLRDTNPNEISGWQWPCSVEDMDKFDVPLYVMGVGYNRFRGQAEFEPCFWESINTLVEKSAFFGLRNHGSIRAVQRYLRGELRDKVVYHPCATTVLSKLYMLPEKGDGEPFIALNCAFDRAGMRYGGRQDEVMRSIARVCKKLSEKYLIKCYIHCYNDKEVLPYLEAEDVPYEEVLLTRELTEEEYLSYFTKPELVLAIRGHAQMIPFGCKTPTVSMISHDKLKWFLEDIGHPEWGIEVLDDEFEKKLLALSTYMLENRAIVCKEIAAAQDKLWEIMQKNMESIIL